MDPIAQYEADEAYARYLVTDEFAEVVLSLRHLADFLEKAEKDRWYWKWAILSAHSATQSAFVAILTQTSGVGALDSKSERELIERLDQDWDSDLPWPKERLARYLDLARKALPLIGRTLPQKPDWNLHNVETDLYRVHLLRNGFAHFKPATWLIETNGLPRIVANCVHVVEEIVSSNRYKRWNSFSEYKWQVDVERVRDLLSS